MYMKSIPWLNTNSQKLENIQEDFHTAYMKTVISNVGCLFIVLKINEINESRLNKSSVD